MRRALAIGLLAVLLALAGCALGDEDPSTPAGGAQGAGEPSTDGSAEPEEGEPEEGEIVRDWIDALNAEDYEEAASFFAEGAVVEQLREMRLRDRADAVLFNQSLPCKADVTEVEDEGDATVLATFSLSDGPGGPCEGNTQVRIRFEDDRFAEWRQLPPRPAPEGDLARAG